VSGSRAAVLAHRQAMCAAGLWRNVLDAALGPSAAAALCTTWFCVLRQSFEMLRPDDRLMSSSDCVGSRTKMLISQKLALGQAVSRVR